MSVAAAPRELACDVEVLEVEVCALSGRSAKLSVCGSTRLEEVRVAIEGLIGIPADSQQWLVETDEVPCQEDSTLADTEVCQGDRITVVHMGFVALAPLPDSFHLRLTSARERFGRRYSSAFDIRLEISGSVPDGRMRFEPWRKSDHDRFEWDTKAGTETAVTSHWMAGSQTSTSELLSDPLGELIAAWSAPSRRVTRVSERFWLPMGSDPSAGDILEQSCRSLPRDFGDESPQERPDHGAVPGWFAAPSDDCVELSVDVPLPRARKRISRLLTDREGKPLRAAVHGCAIGHLHLDIEEYDVKIWEAAGPCED